MNKKLPFLFLLLIIQPLLNAQNTFGTISIDSAVMEGYTLISVHQKSYLINNCGEVINEWTSNYLPGNAVYLLEDGSILRTGRTNSSTISFGGRGGVIEKYNWNGNLTWQFFYDTPQYRQHHDIYPMPNGNVLILAATVMSNAEAILAGRNPANLSQDVLFNEQIIEVEPIGASNGNIVWEWNIKDHLVQDFDNTKDNFGTVDQNPNKLDINFLNGTNTNANWLHVNSIQYDDVLDQIVISSRNLSEIWIIDHSTTTAEAASNSGGTYGKGGDLLYRWGNPQAYRQGTESDRVLYGQHTPQRITQGLNNQGKIILFNNGNGRTPLFSEVMIINTPFDSPGFYSQPNNNAFGPTVPDYIYVDTEEITNFYSPILSNAQVLPNGNTLICAGGKGIIFEIDSDETIVWKYIVPVNNETGDIAEQGQSTLAFQNQTFRATKYAPDFSGFKGKDLTPGDPIEQNPNLTPCNNLSINDNDIESVSIFPNPAINIINIKSNSPIDKFVIYDILGNQVMRSNGVETVNVKDLNSGLYFIKLVLNNKSTTLKFIKS
ncbi:aryl-sulfate sulfotransferase [Paucihalobacter sp.]|uniref:aryl-sulfate sulfotransferase n=1 Tax=Paucihalobacter sp. TaxID=2850405 RepID=UPI003D161F57